MQAYASMAKRVLWTPFVALLIHSIYALHTHVFRYFLDNGLNVDVQKMGTVLLVAGKHIVLHTHKVTTLTLTNLLIATGEKHVKTDLFLPSEAKHAFVHIRHLVLASFQHSRNQMDAGSMVTRLAVVNMDVLRAVLELRVNTSGSDSSSEGGEEVREVDLEGVTFMDLCARGLEFGEVRIHI